MSEVLIGAVLGDRPSPPAVSFFDNPFEVGVLLRDPRHREPGLLAAARRRRAGPQPLLQRGPKEAPLATRKASRQSLQMHQADHLRGLPARFTGSEWRFLRAALQEWLRSEEHTSELQSLKHLVC